MMCGMTEGRLIIMRHGETEWSRSGQHTGRTDIPLTERGEAAAQLVRPALEKLALRDPLVISSPRRRARHTAELAGLAVDRIWDDLAEWDYGDYEGLTTPQIQETVPGWSVWTHPTPGSESAEEVSARADTVLALVRSTLPERDVVLIGHGHFSRALLARWAELPVVEGRRFAMSPAAYSVLGYDRGVAQILHHNVTV